MQARFALIVLVSVVFCSWEGISALTAANHSPVSLAEGTLSVHDHNNRNLREHDASGNDKTNEEAEDERLNDDERTFPKLGRINNSLSKGNSDMTSKLVRSNSLPDLSKVDEKLLQRAIESNHAVVFKRIEKAGYDPDSMYLELGWKSTFDVDYNIQHQLWKAFSSYWQKGHPNWVSKIDNTP
ncbi:RxLR effector protein [Phytophthora megakarya]|uniref:RxLR effector protein n=1 Tax=Phytophthora megakarya TaxID=4795 RepID=A0A225VLS8_9STRA|nr:RxLR effector protein [Phytophthora megakarya]